MDMKNIIKVSSMLSLAVVAGCASKPAPHAEAPPMVIDQATQLRDWDRTTAEYANGDTVSPASRSPLVAPVTGVPVVDPLLEPLAALGNAFYLPFSFILTPPGAEMTSTGVQSDPSYTGVVPAPRSTGAVAGDSSPITTVDLTADGTNAPSGVDGSGVDQPPADGRAMNPVDNSGRPGTPSRDGGAPAVNPNALTPGSPNAQPGAPAGRAPGSEGTPDAAPAPAPAAGERSTGSDNAAGSVGTGTGGAGGAGAGGGAGGGGK